MEVKDKTLGITEIECNHCHKIKSIDNYYIFISKHKSPNGILAYKRYRAICKKCQYKRAKKYLANYYVENQEQYQSNGSIWHQANKDRLYQNRKDRMQNDKAFRIKEDLRNATRKAIKFKKGNRALKVNEYLGCTGLEAYNYLVSMGYDETKHVIDHIIPYAFFDFTNPDHQKVCFNYRNLQPLDRIKNIQKSDHLLDGWEGKLKEICQALDIKNIQGEQNG